MPKSLTTEEFKERIKQISNGNIEIIGEYKGINELVSCKCKKCGHIWKNTPNHLLYRKQGCKICSLKDCWNKRNDRTTKENIIKRIKEIFPQYDLSKISENISSQKEKLTIICPKHGEFTASADSLLHGHECKRCSYEKRANLLAFKASDMIYNATFIHGDKYDYSLVPNEVRCDNSIPIICQFHGIFNQTPYHHVNRGQGCPFCKSSHLEKEVESFLKNKMIDYKRHKRFDWLGLQHLDFYLPKYNIAIECQGEQHYKPIDYFGGNDGFTSQKERDSRKLERCKDNNVELLYFTHFIFENGIPNNTFNSIEELFKYINS